MNKPTKKYGTYNRKAVEALMEKHGFTRQFVQAAIRGDRTSATADKIRREYADLVRPSEKKIEQFKNQ